MEYFPLNNQNILVFYSEHQDLKAKVNIIESYLFPIH